MSGNTEVLKAGPARTLLLVRDDDGEETVVKRFHHPRAHSALFDRRRAKRELALLAALHARGLPVPRPCDVRRAPGGGWEVRMERIPGALPLTAWLNDARPGAAPPGGWGRLLARMGRLLARLQAASVEHPDLHAGNVLVDGAGEPWLVDFHHASARTLSDAALRQALVVTAAAGREHLSATLRARFLAAWHRGLPEGRRAALPVPRELGPEVEVAARAHRRAAVARRAARWTRASSRCHVHADGAGELVLRRDVPASEARALRGAAGVHVLAGLAPSELRARWLAAARLHEHGVPVTAPLAWNRGRDGWAAFALPPGASGARAPSAAALGALAGALHERGLVLARPGPGDLVVGADGAARLLPPAGLLPFDPRSAGRAERLGPFAALSADADEAAFATAYLAAFDGWPAERDLVAARLRR